jgi:hypothetical protein
MKRISFVILLSLTILILQVDPGFAFRCNGRIISAGDTKFDVLQKCGEPTFKDSWVENRISRDLYRDILPRNEKGSKRELERKDYREPLFVEEYVVIDEWIYNLGPTRFVRYLTFENGKLVRIRTGEYGY